MSLRSDHKALMFLGVVGVLGAGVRVVRAASSGQAPSSQPALERQARAADSAAAAQKKAKALRTGQRAPTRSKPSASATDTTGRFSRRAGPLDRPGYIAGRLDLDVATASQIDSLPGVSALMARRIATDRAKRGPFLSLDGLRRVSGAGQGFLRKIDTLVTFSGTFTRAAPEDTIIKPRRKRR